MGRTPLLERDQEVAAVAQAVSEVLGGHGRLVVIEGDAGVGKTRLLAHLRELPEAADLRIFSARGSELERHFAFGLVRQLFEPALMRVGDEERRRLLSGAARGAAPVFADDARTAVDAELAVLHGLYWLTVALTERPALLLLDDLQWSDAASLRYLAYLIPRLDDLRLLVAAVVRTGERSSDPMLHLVLAAPEAVVLRPGPLSEAATATLLAGVLGRPASAEFTAACFRATSGNPLLLHALAGHAAREGIEPTAANAGRVTEVGSQAIVHLVETRLANTGDVQRGVARVVAVLGQGASLVAVAELAGIDLVTAQEAVGELTAAGLLDPVSVAPARDARVSYTHAVIAACVYGEMGARERARAHRRAADVLARLGADPERVGAHLLKAPPAGDPDVLGELRRAATVAENRGSAEAALAFLERGVDEATDENRLDLLLEAARVAVQVDVHAAVRLLEQARDVARDPVTLARVAAELGRAYGFLLEPERAFQAFHEALDHLPPDAEDERRRLEATLLVGAFIVPGRLDVARRLPELKALPAHGSLGGLMLDAAIALHETAECDPQGHARARAALADGRLVREANGEGALVCGWLTLLAADDEAAMESLDASVEQAHLYGSVRALAAAYCFRSLGRSWRGQLAEAERDARDALRLAETGRVDMDPGFAGSYLADVLIEQGRLAEAEAVLRSVGVPGPRSAKPRYSVLDTYARLLRHQGRYRDAVAAAVEAGEAWGAYGYRNPALGGWRTDGSLALFALGRVDEARALAEEELDLARRWGAPRARGRALRVVGQVTGGADGLVLVEQSVDVLTGSVARLEAARSLLELGSALRRAGRRTAARERLSAALDHAEVCGATPVGEQAEAELRAAGYRPRRHRLTGPDALTPSELRVARAAAGGATNREIAQSLFITTKTVEVHLSNVFRKLGVSRRTELARHLGLAEAGQGSRSGGG